VLQLHSHLSCTKKSYMKGSVEYRVNGMSTTKHDGLVSNTVVMIQRTNATTNSSINKIGMLQRTKILQRTRKNTIGRRSTRVSISFRAFPLWLQRHSSYLLPFGRFSYLLICAFSSENIFFKLFCCIILAMSRQNRVRKLDGNFAVGCGPGTDYP
jgi:hypothetical protein